MRHYWPARAVAQSLARLELTLRDERYAENLHPAARSAYVQCYDQKLEKDRYNPELGD